MEFIETVELKIFSAEVRPEHFDAWRTYLNEAKWGWLIIEPAIASLAVDSNVLEVGAGSQALTAQVASRGMKVTAIEPSSVGFSIMKTLGDKVHALSSESGIQYEIIDTTGEQFDQVEKFDFAFSINVMEHVRDINAVLDNVMESLKIGGTYQFICPNYLFPFEPHFNFPTLVNKRLTDLFIRKFAVKLSNASDPEGLWSSLNWISVRQINKWAKNTEGISVQFSNRALEMYASRAISDQVFIDRHKFISRVFKNLHPIMSLVIRKTPKVMSPFIDVTLTRVSHPIH